jgi:hypothetical protein
VDWMWTKIGAWLIYFSFVVDSRGGISSEKYAGTNPASAPMPLLPRVMVYDASLEGVLVGARSCITDSRLESWLGTVVPCRRLLSCRGLPKSPGLVVYCVL